MLYKIIWKHVKQLERNLKKLIKEVLMLEFLQRCIKKLPFLLPYMT